MKRTLVKERTGWQRVAPEESARFLLRERRLSPFRHFPLDGLGPEVSRSFAAYNRWTLQEYLYRYTGDLRIEPLRGYVLTDDWRIVPESMPYYYHEGFPPVDEHARALNTLKTLRVPAVVSLRDFGEMNYYHFFNDVLAKLSVIETAGVARDWPLVISRRLSEQKYFRDALERSRALREREWVVQDEFFIEAGCVVFCQAMPHVRRNFDDALRLLEAPPADEGARDRVFLTRGARRRHLRNAAEVEEVCRRFDFRVTDADELSLHEQIELFSRARYVVGIHGAGLTNIIFRRDADLDLLEIFPPSSLPAHYYWLSHHHGYAYNAVTGAHEDDDGNFVVDARALGARLERSLKN